MEIKPHGDYTVFLYFSQITNHVFDVHSIGLSFILRFQPLHADFVPCSSHTSSRYDHTLKCHVSAGMQVIITRTQQRGERNVCGTLLLRIRSSGETSVTSPLGTLTVREKLGITANSLSDTESSRPPNESAHV